MVQLATWTIPQNISITTGKFIAPRWVEQQAPEGGSVNIEFVWPFPVGGGGGSFWKGFHIIVYSQQGNGTATMSRAVNEVEVGTKLTLQLGEPLTVPFDFIDLVNVELFKFDRLSIRIFQSFPLSTIPKVNFISYFEFPDGFWGF
jgi:hypothetical protein